MSRVDVKRPYFNAKVDPDATPIFVQLPDEDPDSGAMCGQLLRHMYGTRMAADGWQEEYSSFLVRKGFRQGMASPNVFHHRDRGLYCSVHGDDFTTVGGADQLDWFEGVVSGEYVVSIEPRLGPGPEDAKEGTILNRVVSWREDGLRWRRISGKPRSS